MASGGPHVSPRSVKPVDLTKLTNEAKLKMGALITKRLSEDEIPDKSWGFMTKEHPVRKFCIHTMRQKWFENLSIAVIIANCIMISIYDPLDRDDSGARNRAIADSELPFNLIFTVEMVIKLIALGLTGKGSYFGGDKWNWLDAFIVTMGYVQYLPGVSNLSALRTFRVLRPLRTLSSMPGMRVIVSSMLTALPALGNVMLLAMLTLLIFGIVGVQLWAGLLRGSCGYTDPDTGEAALVPGPVGCALPCDQQRGSDCSAAYGDACAPYPLLRTDAQSSATFIDVVATSCVEGENPAYDTVGFDHVGQAVLTLYTAITMEGWTDTMYAMQRAWGVKWVVALYFIALTSFGAFFLLQLALAVIWENYQRSEGGEVAKAERLIESFPHLLPRKRSRRRSSIAQMRLVAASVMSMGREAAIGILSRMGSSTGRSGKMASASVAPMDSVGGHIAGASLGAGVAGAAGVGAVGGAGAAEAGGGGGGGAAQGGHGGAEGYGAAGKADPAGAVADWPATSSASSSSTSSVSSGRPLIVTQVADSSPSSASSSTASSTRDVDGAGAVKEKEKEVGGSMWGNLAPVRGASRQQHVWEVDLDAADEEDEEEAEARRKAALPPPLPRWPALHAFTVRPLFTNFIMAAILANFVQLMVPYKGMTAEYMANLDTANYVFSAIFGMEMILKLVGWGPALYFSETFNMFDFVVVLLSFVDIGLTVAAGESAGGLAALRTFRLARVMKLARGWPELRRMMATITMAIGQVTNAVFVLCLIMLIFTLLGMQLLGGAFQPAVAAGLFDEVPRANFDTFLWGFITVFQVCTGENWNDVLANGYHAVGPTAIAYFIALNLIGAYMFLNLFLAILLGAFESGMEAAEEEGKAGGGKVEGEGKADEGKVLKDATDQAATTSVVASSAAVPPSISAGPMDGGAAASAPAHASTPLAASAAVASGLGNSRRSSVSGGAPLETMEAQMVMSANGRPAQFQTRMPTAAGGTGPGVQIRILPSGDVRVVHGDDEDALRTQASQSLEDDDDEDSGSSSAGAVGGGGGWTLSSFFFPQPPTRTSCCCLRPSHPIRRISSSFVRNPYFERLILFLILVSSINLALDEPRIGVCSKLPPSDPENCIALEGWLYYSDVVITSLFVLEMAAKITTLGFARTKFAYLKNSWNILDFVIVIISVLSLALADQAAQLKALRSLRALRALRPLRVVSRYPGLKLVVNAIFGAIPKVRTVVLVNFLFLIVLGVVGLQNFMGALDICNDPDVTVKADCEGTFSLTGDMCVYLPTGGLEEACRNTNGTDFPRLWEPQTQNFDNIFVAVLSVFELATGENWPNIMASGADAVGSDQPGKRDFNPAAGLYFVVIQVACGMFLLDLFTGVVIGNFEELKEQSQGSGLLTPEQQLWVEQTKVMMSSSPNKSMKKPDPSKGPLWLRRIRNRVFAIVTSTAFEWAIMSVIVFNTAVLAMKHYGWTDEWISVTEGLNNAFALIFAVEAALKLLAFGPKQYFSLGWNRFDFLLVLASLAGVLGNLGPIATLLRVFRVARIFRLIRSSRGLQLLFRTLIVSMPSLVNVGTILVLLLFIFSILGMNLFSGVRYGRDGLLSENANFDSFWVSMLTLYRAATGENYNYIMHGMMVQPPYCLPDGEQANCGNTVAPPFFWILYFVLSAFIIVQLLVAVVLDNFSDAMAADEAQDTFRLTSDIIDAFADAWSAVDPQATTFTDNNGLIKVVSEIPYPMGVLGAPGMSHEVSVRKAASNILMELEVAPTADGRYQYHSVLQALVSRASALKSGANGGTVFSARIQMKGSVKQAEFTLAETIAATRMQNIFRARKARKAMDARRSAIAEGRIPSPPNKEELDKIYSLKLQRAGSKRGQLGVVGEVRPGLGHFPPHPHHLSSTGSFLRRMGTFSSSNGSVNSAGSGSQKDLLTAAVASAKKQAASAAAAQGQANAVSPRPSMADIVHHAAHAHGVSMSAIKGVPSVIYSEGGGEGSRSSADSDGAPAHPVVASPAAAAVVKRPTSPLSAAAPAPPSPLLKSAPSFVAEAEPPQSKDTAATRIQSIARGRAARAEVSAKRASTMQGEAKEADAESEPPPPQSKDTAATRIQSIARGRAARAEVSAKRASTMQGEAKEADAEAAPASTSAAPAAAAAPAPAPSSVVSSTIARSRTSSADSLQMSDVRAALAGTYGGRGGSGGGDGSAHSDSDSTTPERTSSGASPVTSPLSTARALRALGEPYGGGGGVHSSEAAPQSPVVALPLRQHSSEEDEDANPVTAPASPPAEGVVVVGGGSPHVQPPSHTASESASDSRPVVVVVAESTDASAAEAAGAPSAVVVIPHSP